MIRIIDLSAICAVVEVVIGVGKGIHGVTPSPNRARGQHSGRTITRYDCLRIC
jgi:hypothetical protein